MTDSEATLRTDAALAALWWLRAIQPAHGSFGRKTLELTFPLLEPATVESVVNAYCAETGTDLRGRVWSLRPHDSQAIDGTGDRWGHIRHPVALPDMPAEFTPAYRCALHVLGDYQPLDAGDAERHLTAVLPTIAPEIHKAAVAQFIANNHLPERLGEHIEITDSMEQMKRRHAN